MMPGDMGYGDMGGYDDMGGMMPGDMGYGDMGGYDDMGGMPGDDMGGMMPDGDMGDMAYGRNDGRNDMGYGRYGRNDADYGRNGLEIWDMAIWVDDGRYGMAIWLTFSMQKMNQVQKRTQMILIPLRCGKYLIFQAQEF